MWSCLIIQESLLVLLAQSPQHIIAARFLLHMVVWLLASGGYFLLHGFIDANVFFSHRVYDLPCVLHRKSYVTLESSCVRFLAGKYAKYSQKVVILEMFNWGVGANAKPSDICNSIW